MKQLVIMMTVAAIGFSACNASDTKTDDASQVGLAATESKTTKQETMEKKFTYKEGNVEEIITVQFTTNGKEVVSATHHTVGGATHPISFGEMEYADELELFMGFATCPAWEGDAMVGIEADLSKLGWNDGITKKSYSN